jgi:YfiH family protein
MSAATPFQDPPLHKYPCKLETCSNNSIPNLRFFSFSGLNGLAHWIFTRHGGVSPPPYDSLNTSYQNGDRPGNVGKNLRLIRESIKAGRLLFMNQVHGRNIIRLSKKDYSLSKTSLPDADAIITDIPDMAIMVKQADCQGVIMYDPIMAVLAIAHCGWRGNVHNILGLVVDNMKSGFGCDPSHILAAIGPSLGPCCAEFRSYQDIFPEGFFKYMVRDDYFDLWDISRNQLLDAGLSDDGIEIAGICTKCNNNLFYSYRAEGITGRFATVAMLRGKKSNKK